MIRSYPKTLFKRVGQYRYFLSVKNLARINLRADGRRPGAIFILAAPKASS